MQNESSSDAGNTKFHIHTADDKSFIYNNQIAQIRYSNIQFAKNSLMSRAKLSEGHIVW